MSLMDLYIDDTDFIDCQSKDKEKEDQASSTDVPYDETSLCHDVNPSTSYHKLEAV